MRTTKLASKWPSWHFRAVAFLFTDPYRKYGADGKQLEKWSGDDLDGKRMEKEQASQLFKGYWRRCISYDKYLSLKEEWQQEKKEFEDQRKTSCKSWPGG